MKKGICLLLLLCVLGLVPTARAADAETAVTAFLTVEDGAMLCQVRIDAPGRDLETTVELWQEGDRVAVWRREGRSVLTVSERRGAPGGACTLRVTGMADGQAFAPVVLTRAG